MESYILEHMSTINISYDESYGSIYDHIRNEHQMHAPFNEESEMSISAIKMYPWKSFSRKAIIQNQLLEVPVMQP